jgi:hypothetical protein
VGVNFLIDERGSRNVSVLTLHPVLAGHESRAAVGTVSLGTDLPADPDEASPPALAGKGQGLTGALSGTRLQVDGEPVLRAMCWAIRSTSPGVGISSSSTASETARDIRTPRAGLSGMRLSTTAASSMAATITMRSLTVETATPAPEAYTSLANSSKSRRASPASIFRPRLGRRWLRMNPS